MADFNKTVEIQVRADMKQLLTELKKMPGMSAKEAKKMVSELSKNYKQAANEAKKAAKKNKTAMDSMTASNNKAAKSAKNLRTQSREMGAAFGSLEDVVGGINPELAGVASNVGVVGQGFRSLSRSLATGNMLVTGAVIGLALLAGAYTVATAKQRRAKEIQEAYASSVERTTEKLEKQRTAALSLISAQRESNRKLAVLTGQRTQLEADIEAARDRSGDSLRSQLKTQDEIIAKQEGSTKLVNQAVRDYQSLTDEQLKELDILAASSEKQLVNQGIANNSSKRQMQLLVLQDEMNKRLSVEQNHKLRIKEKNDEILQTDIEKLKLQDEFRRESEEEDRRQEKLAKQAKKRAEAEAKRKENQRKADNEAEKARREAEKEAEKEKRRIEKLTLAIQKTGHSAQQKAEQLSIANSRTRNSLLDDQVEKLKANLQLDKDIIQSKIDSLQEQQRQNNIVGETENKQKEAKEANLAIDAQINELKEQAHLKDMKFAKDRSDALKKEKNQRLELLKSIATQTTESVDAISQIIQNVSGENKKAAMIAFRVNQAAAIANIVMTTAQKVMEVAPNPFAIAGVSALGALQAGVVATQPPPEMHMGGVIGKGEDTRNITVLTGEAVLDRRTVQNLGGEQGISALQRGEGLSRPDVIVMNPFKHFDRYAKASSKRGGVMGKFSNTKAAGVY